MLEKSNILKFLISYVENIQRKSTEGATDASGERFYDDEGDDDCSCKVVDKKFY